MRVRVDHLLVDVADMDAALSWYRDTLGMREVSVTEISLSDGSHIDNRVLEAPDDDFSIVLGKGIEPWGMKAKQLARHGPGVHHVAYEVDDLDAAIAEMRARGVEFLTDEPTENEDLRQIFTKKHPDTGMIHEFIQRIGGRRGFAAGNITNLAEAASKET